jgi:hypothetical protein
MELSLLLSYSIQQLVVIVREETKKGGEEAEESPIPNTTQINYQPAIYIFRPKSHAQTELPEAVGMSIRIMAAQ